MSQVLKCPLGTLSELYDARLYEDFASRFLSIYGEACERVQLAMVRDLLCKWRNEEVLQLVCEHL